MSTSLKPPLLQRIGVIAADLPETLVADLQQGGAELVIVTLAPEVLNDKIALCEALFSLYAKAVEKIVLCAVSPALCAELQSELPLPLCVFDEASSLANLLACAQTSVPKPFKIGVVGGVGPAATVDFLAKIVRYTPADCDQDHLKVVLEQNPQIPDRTAHLLGNGADPSLALYATCKRLELAGASILTIPCNTAHAFVDKITPFLNIPIIHLLSETVAYIRQQYPEKRQIGLLATSGTLQSRVYHERIEAAGLQVIEASNACQAKVMKAIYGKKGAKAGFTTGECADDLHAALRDVQQQGAEIVILGCTELPLIIAQDTHFMLDGKPLVVLDPSTILAQRCIALARN